MNVVDFESKVTEAVKTGGMPSPGSHVVTALSGGADSVALTVALHRLGYRLTAVHCNYHLRGSESNRDARSVRQLCRRLGIALECFDFDVEARRKATGESVEMACRELRYDAFASVCESVGAEGVAVGHHREDNIETFFINLLRGSGLRGLTGMKPWDSTRRVMRPLLGLTRDDIETYLRTLGIGWVNDSSNASNDYRRNKLRNVVIPAFRSMFPDCEERISTSLSLLGANRSLYDRLCADIRRSLTDSGQIDVARLTEMYPMSNEAEMALYEMLAPEGFNMSQCRDILRSSLGSGRIFEARGVEWLLDRGCLRKVSDKSFNSRLSFPPVVEVIDEPFTPPAENDPTVIYLSEDVLKAGDLSFRPWHAGDRIQPFGMKGSRKVSDVLSDAKVPRDAKSRTRLLVLTAPDGRETILWVCGLRTSRHFTVSRGARRYLRIRTIPT